MDPLNLPPLLLTASTVPCHRQLSAGSFCCQGCPATPALRGLILIQFHWFQKLWVCLLLIYFVPQTVFSLSTVCDKATNYFDVVVIIMMIVLP